MYINGSGTATPPWHYSQSEVWDALSEDGILEELQPRSRRLLRKVLHGDNGIDGRYLAVPSLDQAFVRDPGPLHDRFARHAPHLASCSAREALSDAGIATNQVDALIVSTCTGYLCPGLSSYAVETLGLRPGTFCLDLVGQGCGAALPNLKTAEALVASGRAENVLCVCVEICSAAFYLNDDPGVIISACLFGDGAAAAVVSRNPPETGRSIEWIASATHMIPEDREALRFEHDSGLLRNVLTPEVPSIAAVHARNVFDEVGRKTGVTSDQITSWLWHAGGKNVLLALREAFELEKEAVGISSELLEQLGNVSSPFVLFALAEARRRHLPDGLWWMASFGAGFSSHGALLRAA